MVNNTQYLTGGKSPNPLDPPSNFVANAGNSKVTLTWTDPPNATAEPSGQTIATWAYTKIVRKEGSQPTGPTDGTVVVTSSTRDQYAINGYLDTGLTNDTQYYYGAFAYNSDGVVSEGSFASATPVAGVPLSSFAEGDIIKIQEDGIPVEFYVAKQGYEPTLNFPGRVLVVRKDVYDKRPWNSTSVNAWATSTLFSWLNGDYKSLFSSNVQQLMGETKYQYTPGNNNWTVSTITGSVFLLSFTELGLTGAGVNVEGTALPVYESIQTAYLQGNATNYWTRSPSTRYNDSSMTMTTSGYGTNSKCTNPVGSRPCFTLPSETLIDPDGVLIEGQPIPDQKAPLSALAEGTLITINENGAPVEFYVAKQNYESELNGEGRVLMVRKNIQSYQRWDSDGINAYAESTIDAWLNETYKNMLSVVVQTMVETTIFPYTPSNGNNTLSSLSRSVFILSLGEFGISRPKESNQEGSELPISDVLTIAYYNGVAHDQWTRTPFIVNSNVFFIRDNGAYSGINPVGLNDIGARPCFTLPSTAYVDANLALIETA